MSASPTVNGSFGNTPGTTGTSISLTMPSSIVAEEMLVLWTFCSGSSAPACSSQWHRLDDRGSSSLGWFSIFTKRAGEGADTATLTPSGSQTALALCCRLGGAVTDYNLWSINSTDNGGSGGAPNPPSLTPIILREGVFFVAGGGGNAPSLTAPTNYSGIVQSNFSTAACMAVAQRALAASGAEDPAAFGNGATITNTIQSTLFIPGLDRMYRPPNRARNVRASHF